MKVRTTVRVGIAGAIVASSVAGLVGVASAGDPASRYGDFNGDNRKDLAIGAPFNSVGNVLDAGAVRVVPGSDTGANTSATALRREPSPEEGNGFGYAIAWGDFDNDGFDDLASGAPGNEIGGVVQVNEGSAAGLSNTALRYKSNTPVNVGAAEWYDGFGNALAVGDFDNDEFDDLAVGVPGEGVGSIDGAGAVVILYGSSTGLGTRAAQFHENSPGVPGSSEADDYFGWDVAAGDFDNDAYDDLVVATAGEDVGSAVDAGSFTVLPGGAGGVGVAGALLLHGNSPDMAGTAEANDFFGTSVTVGDFDNDTFDDLAVGAYGESLGSIRDAGAFTLVEGSLNGLTAIGSREIHADTAGVAGAAETDDLLGADLVAGDFDNDSFDDLAVGAAGETVNGQRGAGLVVAFKGSGTGVLTAGSVQLVPGSGGMAGVSEQFDAAGWALSASDLDGDGYDDLSIGVPGETAYGQPAAGSVLTLDGSATFLSTATSRQITANSTGVPGDPKPGAFLGWSLA